MQIISELEPQKRGLYAGAIGYFGYNGNLDTCIVIRTIVMKGKKVFITAGAGIVADSDPKMEYQETLDFTCTPGIDSSSSMPPSCVAIASTTSW